MNQKERLDYLVEKFKEESQSYRGLETPADTVEKKCLLRSLMNVRMPGQLAPAVEEVQDEYLQQRNMENGIVTLEAIPTIAEQGSRHRHGDRISLWQGDITRLKVQAIVNAANSQMLGCFIPMHSCIDNCIHTYAGVQLRNECFRRMNVLRRQYGQDYEQPTAVPMLTDGYNLPAEKVIHIVGPIVSGQLTEALEQDLAACYRNTLNLCEANGLRSVAFCCLSTGVFRFPNRPAAQIAVRTVSDWLDRHPEAMDRVIFNVFKDEDKEYYEKELYQKA